MKGQLRLHVLPLGISGGEGVSRPGRFSLWYFGSRAGLDVLKNRKLFLLPAIETRFLIFYGF